MVTMTVIINDEEYRAFKNMVGEGKVSERIREFVRSFSKNIDSLEERRLRKRLEIIMTEKDKVDAEFFELKSKLDAIDSQKKQEELKRLEKEAKDYKIMQAVKANTMKADLHRLIGD